ncbi:hypothetical protein RND81_11G156000 [Saponaria officinalis]|uniref:Uncharacterized protein n=1 Tax=Saponaria officinalis TaxID=3572 RepID=A0AAW1HMG9_SAPOF
MEKMAKQTITKGMISLSFPKTPKPNSPLLVKDTTIRIVLAAKLTVYLCIFRLGVQGDSSFLTGGVARIRNQETRSRSKIRWGCFSNSIKTLKKIVTKLCILHCLTPHYLL